MDSCTVVAACPCLSFKVAIVSLLLISFSCSIQAWNWPNYQDALSKSILFYEGQRSGKLPPTQRLTWRRDSAQSDGLQDGVDLVGGYYDAGDGVKFSFPMAFTTTILSWSVVEYGALMEAAGELENAKTAVRWATDYLLKTTVQQDVIYAQVGDPNTDHPCWERPEDMDVPRNVYVVDASNPGSDLAGEIAAAFAAASIVFTACDSEYSSRLLEAAMQVFRFADGFRGSYSNAFSAAVCPYYCSYSGYEDELLWGAGWLYKATGDANYMQYVLDNGPQLGQTSPPFSWDDKHAGVHVLLSELFLKGDASELNAFKARADAYICSIMPDVQYSQKQASTTPGGLIFVRDDENLQYATSTAFLLFTYSNYLTAASETVSCQTANLDPHQLWTFAKQQVDYILGQNPLQMSYMVGHGSRYPEHLHHRASSLPCMEVHPQHIGCKDGFVYFDSGEPNPNLLVGAVSGGPDSFDQYMDDRSNYQQSEPTIYVNAPLVGALAYLTSFRQ